MLRIDYFNDGENNETNVTISLDIDGLFFSNKTIDIEKNQTYEWLIDWTQDGDIELKIALSNSITKFSIGSFDVNIVSRNSTEELSG